MPDGLRIACLGVRKTYRTPGGNVEALHAADALFEPGQVNVVMGPSGCGKSTLLRVVAGLDGADTGVVTTGGVDVTALEGRRLREYRRSTVTYVAQRAAANLVSHLRLRDHLERGDGVELFGTLGLADRLGARASELSGGEQARAALAAAVSRDTPVLLLDEPTAELDREAAAHVLDVLSRTAAGGATVVVATHDADLAAIAQTRLDLAGRRAHAHRPSDSVASVGEGAGIRVRGLVKRYGPTHAVDDVSFELPPGHVGIVLGRSGSGKSTLLMAVGGWLEPDAGTVSLGRRPSWRSVGYLPQRFGLLPELSIASNVRLPVRLGGGGDDVADLLDRLDLAAVARRLPAETSIGQQQRAALARALVQRPAVLLADEPTSHQDAESAELAWQAILDARAHGTACLVATHDVAAAARGDSVWQLVDGRLGTYSSGNCASSR